MKGYNVVVVFNKEADKMLMCKRIKEPYLGLSNFVGGKIEEDEDGMTAAYRELFEETSIEKDDIRLTHLMDFTYHMAKEYVEVYVGRLKRDVEIRGDENILYWSELDCDFFNPTLYAGEGNIGHIMMHINFDREKLLDL